MTTDKFNRLCAEAEGFVRKYPERMSGDHFSAAGDAWRYGLVKPFWTNGVISLSELPDYSTDLTAMLRVCEKLGLSTCLEHEPTIKGYGWFVSIQVLDGSKIVKDIGKEANDPTKALMKAMMEAFDDKQR